PAWPAGLCGSIAHSASHVAVAMALTSQLRSVGIDIEDGRSLDGATNDVATAEEIDCLVAHPLAGNAERAARLVFSAKETIYKCQAPLSGNACLSFTEVRLEMAAGGGLKVYPTAPLGPSTTTIISEISVLFKIFQGLTLAIAWIYPMSSKSV